MVAFLIRRCFVLLAILLALSATPAMAALIIWDFTTAGDPGPGLTLYTDPGFSVVFDGDWAVFAGGGTGFARLLTDAWYSGDFTAVTVANRMSLSVGAGLGLVAYYSFPPVGDAMFDDVYLNGSSYVTSFIYVASTHYEFGEVADPSATVWLRLQRTGSMVSSDYCVGTDYLTCAWVPLTSMSDSSLAGPVRIGLFLGPGQATNQGKFDVLAVDGNSVPEPATASLLGAGILALACLRLRAARKPS